MQLHLKFIGWLLVVLSVIHAGFPRYFKWKEELQHLSLINRQMKQVHTFFIALTVLLIGLLCVTSADDLVTTALGRRIAFGMFIFWGIRLVTQFTWYSPMLWRGKRFETLMHIIFSGLWAYLTAVFYLTWHG